MKHSSLAVVLDFWRRKESLPGPRYTTIGNWRQQWRDIHFRGENYSWSKHLEFQKFLGHGGEACIEGCLGQRFGPLHDSGCAESRAVRLGPARPKACRENALHYCRASGKIPN